MLAARLYASVLVAAVSVAIPASAATPPPHPGMILRAAPLGIEAALKAKQSHLGKAVVAHFPIPADLGAAPGWLLFQPSDAIRRLQALPDFRGKCDAADPSTPPWIGRVQSPIGPGADIEIDGDCFGTGPGSVELLGLPSGNVGLKIKNWSKTALSVAVPAVPGAHRQKVTLQVTRAAAKLLTQPRLGPGGGAAGQSSQSVPVDFWPAVVTQPAASDQVKIRSCASAYWNPGYGGNLSACFSAGDPRVQSAWGPICNEPCAFHVFVSQVPITAPSMDSGDDVWAIAHPAGWGVASVTLGNTCGTVSVSQPSDALNQTLVTVHWADVQIRDYSSQYGQWFGAGYDLVVTLIRPQ